MTVARQHTGPGLLGLCVWALGFAFRRWLPLLGLIATHLLRVGLDVLKPWPMVFLIDYVLRAKAMPGWVAGTVEHLPWTSTPLHLAGWSVAATVLVFLLSWAVGLAATYGNINLGQRMTYDLAADLFEKLQQLSLHFHARKSVGDNIRRVTSDCGCAAIIVKDALIPIFSSVVSLAAMFSILWSLHHGLALLSVAVVPFMVVVFRAYSEPMMTRSYQQQEVDGRIYGFVEQTLSAIPVVQAFTREPLNDRRLAAFHSDTLAATLKLTSLELQFKVFIGLITGLATAGILWFGAKEALAGALSLGTIIAFLSYLGSLYAPLESIMYTGSTIRGASGSARRVWEVLQTETRVQDKPGALRLSRPRGQVEFQNVTFGYEPGRPVLHDISLKVEPGQCIALVGATGAGKSTLVSLLPRFFDPWDGRVLLDDVDLRDLQLKNLRSHIAIVLQDPFLFPISVAQNIAYGSPNATAAEIIAAAKIASAHDFISRLPQRYETIIGERGSTLSGGERQRISIARALLRQAPLLVLDEPTSALDAETEHALMQALESLTRDRTTFIIAHRLSTIRRANRIIVLQQGAIVEWGTHEQLLAQRGVYERLFTMQMADRTIIPVENGRVGPGSSLGSNQA